MHALGGAAGVRTRRVTLALGALLALAIVRWLAREERGTAVASRIPVPPMILLTGAQMRGIFIVIEVLLPLAAFALGALAWWRRR